MTRIYITSGATFKSYSVPYLIDCIVTQNSAIVVQSHLFQKIKDTLSFRVKLD